MPVLPDGTAAPSLNTEGLNPTTSDDFNRNLAATLDLDYDALQPEEIDFLGQYQAMMRVDAEAQPPAPEGNPLIPTDDGATAIPAATPPPVPTGDDVAGAGVRTEPDASGAVIPAGGGVIPAPIPTPLIPIDGYGQLPAEEVQRAIALARGITPQELELINNIRTGQLPPPTAQAPAPPAVPDFLAAEWEDPNARRAFDALFSVVQENQENARREAEYRVASQRHELEVGLEQGSTAFRTDYPLDDPTFDTLVTRVGQYNLLNALQPQYPGNPSALAKAALEQAYWMDPALRQQHVTAAIAAHQEQVLPVASKKANQQGISSPAGAVQSSGSSASLPVPAADRNERDRQIAAYITNPPSENGSNGNDITT